MSGVASLKELPRKHYPVIAISSTPQKHGLPVTVPIGLHVTVWAIPQDARLQRVVASSDLDKVLMFKDAVEA